MNNLHFYIFIVLAQYLNKKDMMIIHNETNYDLAIYASKRGYLSILIWINGHIELDDISANMHMIMIIMKL